MPLEPYKPPAISFLEPLILLGISLNFLTSVPPHESRV